MTLGIGGAMTRIWNGGYMKKESMTRKPTRVNLMAKDSCRPIGTGGVYLEYSMIILLYYISPVLLLIQQSLLIQHPYHTPFHLLFLPQCRLHLYFYFPTLAEGSEDLAFEHSGSSGEFDRVAMVELDVALLLEEVDDQEGVIIQHSLDFTFSPLVSHHIDLLVLQTDFLEEGAMEGESAGPLPSAGQVAAYDHAVTGHQHGLVEVEDQEVCHVWLWVMSRVVLVLLLGGEGGTGGEDEVQGGHDGLGTLQINTI